MENYIVINGKKAELTEEQLKQLGIKVEKENPFTRTLNKEYFSINAMNIVTEQLDRNDGFDKCVYNVANYFNGYKFAEQVALHQLLYRKLLKFSYDNNSEARWDIGLPKYYIALNIPTKRFLVLETHCTKTSDVCFSSEDVAKSAITEVLEPFMEEHPKFVW